MTTSLRSALFLVACVAVPTLGGAQARSVVKITGERHKLVLFSDGTVAGWGDHRDGQLGPQGTITDNRGESAGLVAIALPGKAVDVATGERTSYIALADGRVVTFGWGMDGELGLGEQAPRTLDQPTVIPGLKDVVAVAGGYRAGFAIHRDGTVSAWGSRQNGQIGDGIHSARWGENAPRAVSPIKVPGAAGVVQMAVAHDFVLALTKSGTVLSWGYYLSKLGRPVADDVKVATPAEVPGLSDVVSVAIAGVSSGVVKRDGTVWVWGHNGYGQLGAGMPDSLSSPRQRPGVAGAVAIAGAAIGRHFLVLLKDGTMRAWGNSDWGQVGAGFAGRSSPELVTPKITGVKAIFAAQNNSFAVRGDGSVWIWGSGDRGSWPLGANAKLPVPLDLSGH